MVDKYLADYEDNKIAPDVVARRVDKVSDEIGQLRRRRDELTLLLDADTGEPNHTHLAQVRHHLVEIIDTADARLRKTLCQAVIVHVRLNPAETATPVLASA